MNFLERAFSYYFRVASLVILLVFFATATSMIGETGSKDPLTWIGAWKVAGMMASFMLVAFLAGRESNRGAK